MRKKKIRSSKLESDLSPKIQVGNTREIGINIIGAVPWGTHLCQFYKTSEDLIDILVPYFKTGLKNNEFCMWITSEPLHVDEAKNALKKALNNLDFYLKKGQIEILDSSDWYTKSGKFDADEVLAGWVKKEEWARKRGFDGLRLSGNTFWLEKKDWEDFKKYEESINNVIGKYHMIAICSYSLDKCTASEIIDVMNNHQFALIKREGKWQRIENAEHKKAKEKILESEKQFLSIAQSTPVQISISRFSDGTILYTNSAYDTAFGYAHGELIGKKAPDLYSDPSDRVQLLHALKTQGYVKDYEVKVKRSDGTRFWVSASIQPFIFAGESTYLGISLDITEQKQATEMLRESEAKYRNLFDSMTEGFVLGKTIYDDNGEPIDYIFLEANDSFYRHKGIKKEIILNKRITEVIPGIQEDFVDWIGTYGNVAKTGKPIRFENYAKYEKKWYSLYVYSPKQDYFAVIFTDITERKKTEAQLRRIEAEIRTVFDNTPACLVLFDATPPYEVLVHNKSYQELFAEPFRSKGMVGLNVYEYAPDVESSGVITVFDEVVRIKKPKNYLDFPYKSDPPNETWFDWYISPIIIDGKVVSLVSMSLDVTNRHKSEDALIKAKNEWEETFNSVPDLIAILDTKHRIIRANKAMAQRLGVPINQCINLNCHLYVHGKNNPPKLCPHTMTLKDGKEHIAEVYEEKLGGYFLVSTTPLFDVHGILQGSVHVARDITDRKRIEDALKESENRLTRAQEIAHLGSWELDLINNHLSWSDEVYRIFGLQPQEFDATYEAFLEAVHPEDRAAVDAAYSGSLREGRDTYDIEHRMVRKNGEIRIVSEKCKHIRNKSGKVIRSIGMIQDITERKKIEEHLRETRDYLENLLNYANAPIIVWNTDFKITRFNHAFERLTGYTSKEMMGKRLDLLFPKENKEKTLQKIQKTLTGEHWESVEISILQKNGQICVALWNSANVYDSSGKKLLATIAQGQDITERKQIEKELQESEEKYRRIVENTTNVIMVTKPDGIISYISPSCKEIIGYLPEELIGTNPNIFHPADIEKVQKMLSKALNGEKGSLFEYRIITKKGNIKWISHSWAPVFSNKKIQSIISVIEDISNRKETENNIRELNENLIHQTRELSAANKELEAFSYSVSHDLRAPLRSIDGFSQAFIEDYTNVIDEQGKEYLQRVQKASQHMGQLIDDMLKLSRLTRAEMNINKVDLSQIAASIMERLEKEEPERKIDFINQDKIIAEGDPNLINILLENLLGNAWKFTKKCKRSKIVFGKKQINKETVFFVQDNGAGFDMKYINKLFIPFQRLHDDTDYPGTGIGLGIVSRIINRHGGRIWAEGEENKGATFYFTLGGKVNE